MTMLRLCFAHPTRRVIVRQSCRSPDATRQSESGSLDRLNALAFAPSGAGGCCKNKVVSIVQAAVGSNVSVISRRIDCGSCARSDSPILHVDALYVIGGIQFSGDRIWPTRLTDVSSLLWPFGTDVDYVDICPSICATSRMCPTWHKRSISDCFG